MTKNNEILTEEELQIQQDLENGLYKDVEDKREIERYSKIFKNDLERKTKKDKVISIRVNSEELKRLKDIADISGIGYQTYINFVIHQIINQKIVVKAELI